MKMNFFWKTVASFFATVGIIGTLVSLYFQGKAPQVVEVKEYISPFDQLVEWGHVPEKPFLIVSIDGDQATLKCLVKKKILEGTYNAELLAELMHGVEKAEVGHRCFPGNNGFVVTGGSSRLEEFLTTDIEDLHKLIK